MTRLNVCAALLLFSCALATATMLQPSTQPADPWTRDGNNISAVCGTCCSAGSYCGKTAADTVLTKNIGKLRAGDTIPKGTNMTCYMQDRSFPGAVDAGLCLPNLVVDFNVSNFCTEVSNSIPVVNVEYQNDLHQNANTCKPCCNGKSSCTFGYTCHKLAQGWGGVCLPKGSKNSIDCGVQLSNKTLLCESCTNLSQGAQRLHNSLPVGFHSSAPGASPHHHRKLKFSQH